MSREAVGVGRRAGAAKKRADTLEAGAGAEQLEQVLGRAHEWANFCYVLHRPDHGQWVLGHPLARVREVAPSSHDRRPQRGQRGAASADRGGVIVN